MTKYKSSKSTLFSTIIEEFHTRMIILTIHRGGRISVEYSGTVYSIMPVASSIAPTIITMFNAGLVNLTTLHNFRLYKPKKHCTYLLFRSSILNNRHPIANANRNPYKIMDTMKLAMCVASCTRTRLPSEGTPST